MVFAPICDMFRLLVANRKKFVDAERSIWQDYEALVSVVESAFFPQRRSDKESGLKDQRKEG